MSNPYYPAGCDASDYEGNYGKTGHGISKVYIDSFNVLFDEDDSGNGADELNVALGYDNEGWDA